MDPSSTVNDSFDAGLILYLIVSVIVAIIVSVLIFAIYSGLLQAIEVTSGQPPLKNTTIAYVYSTGAYKNSGYYFTEVTSIAPKNKCLGIYYDNPDEVPDEDQWRWIVACILAEGDEEPDKDILKSLQDKGYKLFTLPSISHAVKTTFPHRTVLSIFLGIYKVYPALSQYVESNRLCAHPCIEIYNKNVIEYMLPLAKQDEFYVPEAVKRDEEQEELEEEEELSGESASSEMMEGSSEVLEESKSLSFTPGVSDESDLRRRTPYQPDSGDNKTAEELEPLIPAMEAKEDVKEDIIEEPIVCQPKAEEEVVVSQAAGDVKMEETSEASPEVFVEDVDAKIKASDAEDVSAAEHTEEPLAIDHVQETIVEKAAERLESPPKNSVSSEDDVKVDTTADQQQEVVKEGAGKEDEKKAGQGYVSSDSNTDSEGSFEKVKHEDVQGTS